MPVTLSDPTYAPREDYGAFDRAALKLINDPRDLPFVRLMVLHTVLILPVAGWLFLPGRFSLWLAAAYLVMVLAVLLAPFILMLHNTSHRALFKKQYGFLNHYIPWLLGPFFGESPESYYVHHVGMHHPENNLADDASSTMRYRRDRFSHFMRYFLRFFFLGIYEVSGYFRRKERPALLRRLLVGELSFYVVCALLFALNWRATLVVFAIPFVFTRFMMMAGNWGQHAFIDPAAPDNSYRNSITCINCGYNRRCFNDGYHIGHHLKATRHWTEMPGDFAANEHRYVEEDAIVIQGIDFFIVWLLLMFKRYDMLARRVVSLEGQTRSHAEIVALLRSRVLPIPAVLDIPPGRALPTTP